MAKNWGVLLGKNATKWKIPADVATTLEGLTETAQDTLADAAGSERNAVLNQKVRTAFGELTDFMRDAKRRYFFMPPLSEADWVSLGLRLPDTTPTPIGPPTTVVNAEISYPHKIALSLHIAPVAGGYEDRADWGFRIYFGVLPQTTDITEEMMIERQYLRRVPQNPEELPHSHFTRRKRDLIDFPYDNSGKQCFICVRYENGKGQAGPWGPMASSFIP
jgi:hypothetical protein